MAKTLTRWLLDIIWDNWPEEFPPPEPPAGEAVVRVDRDDPLVLATDARTRSVDLTQSAVIAASVDDVAHSPEGPGPTYETEETAEVVVEGLHAREHGTLGSHAEFRQLVDNVLVALDAERSYPDIALDERSRQPTRLSLFVGTPQDTSSNYRDHYRQTIPLRLRGKFDPDND